MGWRRCDELLAADEPLAWLYGVARNQVRNAVRSKTRRRRLDQAAGATSSGATPDFTEPLIEGMAARAEAAVALHALARLSDQDQEIIRLAAIDRLSHSEIASVLGIRPAAARNRLYRARARLQRHHDEIRASSDTEEP